MAQINPDTVLQRVPLFRGLNAQEMERVKRISIKRFYPKKTFIFTEGSVKEAVFFIQDGLVKTFKTDNDGQEQIVSFLASGDMFPHVGFFNDNPYPATAEAVMDTHLLAIPVQAFESLLLEMPALSIKALHVLGAKIVELQDKLQAITGQDVNQRVVSFLLKLAEQQGEKDQSPLFIDFPFTHEEFANFIGTTRETVSRIFNRLRKEGLIEMHRNRMVVPDLRALLNWKSR